MLKTRTTCRACGSQALTPVLDLGEQYLASNFAMSDKYPPVGRRAPLELAFCSPELDERACGLVQLRHTVPPGLMYASYGYRSGVNKTMREHLATIAREVQAQLEPDHAQQPVTIIDIGANDGTLLLAYNREGPTTLVGYEPSDIRPLGDHNITYIADYFSDDVDECADAVTSIAMFYDLEDPVSFAKSVHHALLSEGVWVLELSYLPTMLAMNSFDTICHEHVAYYSLSTIERVLAAANMAAIDATLNDINGGSIRVTAAKRGSYRSRSISSDARARLYNLRRREFELELDTSRPYEKFARAITNTRLDLRAMLRTMQEQGKTIVGYGASTKGNVILQYTGIGEYLTAIADRNPAKVGGKTVGSNVPIVSEEEMRRLKPDYLLALPWHFMGEFKERERALLEGGTKFIVPLPEPRIIG